MLVINVKLFSEQLQENHKCTAAPHQRKMSLCPVAIELRIGLYRIHNPQFIH